MSNFWIFDWQMQDMFRSGLNSCRLVFLSFNLQDSFGFEYLLLLQEIS